MSDNHIQASFNVGEWAPTLNARVDLQKYHSAAALMQNWTVDYRGGASTRAGTRYILNAYDSSHTVRLIPFQASTAVGYVLEFGQGYMRPFFNGSPILETPTSITAAVVGSPTVFTDAGHGYVNGEWIFVQGNYYIVENVTTNTFTLLNLLGQAINSNPFTLPASAARVFTISSPYLGSELALLKFAQNVNKLVLVHPNHVPMELILIAPTNWTLTAISFGSNVAAPTGVVITTTLGAGSVNYAYVVTTVDSTGQESIPSAVGNLASTLDMESNAGSNAITWDSIAFAASYNVYKANVSYFGVVPTGVTYGFIGNTTNNQLIDTNIGPDFSLTPPIAKTPFADLNPSVVGFFQQRLVLAALGGEPQTFYMSQTGQYYNYNVSDPIEASDAITGTLVSGQQNTIRSLVSVTSGLLMLTDRATWLINGGTGSGSAVSPSSIVANQQSASGVSDVPPILANFDVLYVQAKGSVIRDNAYNIYYNVFTGTDISILSSHLFYGHTILEWAWAEEPFKNVWAVRNDGTMLTLTFLKEQDFVGWTHSTTLGTFLSVATVTEATSTAGEVDAVYVVVQRVVEGQTLKYIERVSERIFPNGVVDAWCVDAGLQYVGAPTTTFTGGQHLAGVIVTGLADGQVLDPFVMPTNGVFTLAVPASKVTVGIGYECDLQTLALDIGEPTVQGKVKKIPSVTVRVADTLGLKIGSDFNHLVPMKDLVRGNVSSMLTGQQSQVVTDLVTGDARTFLDQTYTVPGQYCIRQNLPYPSTVLGVIPNVVQGDDK